MEVRLRVCTLTQIQAHKHTHTRAHILGHPTQIHIYTCPHSWGPPHKHLFVYGQNFSIDIFLDTALFKYFGSGTVICHYALCNIFLKTVSAHLFYRHIVVSIVALVFAIMHYI